MVQPLWKTVLQFLKKLNIQLLYILSFHSSFYPREKKAQVHTKIYGGSQLLHLFNSLQVETKKMSTYRLENR